MQWSSGRRQRAEGARPSGHVPHSITLAFSSSSSCSYSAPICSSSLRVASASSSSTFEIAKPTWIRTQSPGADAAAVGVEQADVDVAPDPGDVDPARAGWPRRPSRRSGLESPGTLRDPPSSLVKCALAPARGSGAVVRYITFCAMTGPVKPFVRSRAYDHERGPGEKLNAYAVARRPRTRASARVAAWCAGVDELVEARARRARTCDPLAVQQHVDPAVPVEHRRRARAGVADAELLARRDRRGRSGRARGRCGEWAARPARPARRWGAAAPSAPAARARSSISRSASWIASSVSRVAALGEVVVAQHCRGGPTGRATARPRRRTGARSRSRSRRRPGTGSSSRCTASSTPPRVLAELELRAVDPDHLQAVRVVAVVPLEHVRQRADRVEVRVVPEPHQRRRGGRAASPCARTAR